MSRVLFRELPDGHKVYVDESGEFYPVLATGERVGTRSKRTFAEAEAAIRKQTRVRGFRQVSAVSLDWDTMEYVNVTSVSPSGRLASGGRLYCDLHHRDDEVLEELKRLQEQARIARELVVNEIKRLKGVLRRVTPEDVIIREEEKV